MSINRPTQEESRMVQHAWSRANDLGVNYADHILDGGDRTLQAYLIQKGLDAHFLAVAKRDRVVP